MKLLCLIVTCCIRDDHSQGVKINNIAKGLLYNVFKACLCKGLVKRHRI